MGEEEGGAEGGGAEEGGAWRARGEGRAEGVGCGFRCKMLGLWSAGVGRGVQGEGARAVGVQGEGAGYR